MNKDTEQGWLWWARLLGRDPAEMDVDEVVTADMAMGEWRRRLMRDKAQAAKQHQLVQERNGQR